MGLIEQTGGAAWAARYFDAEGKEHFHLKRNYLEAAAHFIFYGGPTNQRTTTGGLPVAALIEWFELQKLADGIESASAVADALRLHAVPHLGERRIDSIAAKDIHALVDILTGAVSPAGGGMKLPMVDVSGGDSKVLTYGRAREIASYLGRVYRLAYRLGKIASNPLPRGHGKEASKLPGYLPTPAKALPDPIRYIDERSYESARRFASAPLRAGIELMTDGVAPNEINALGEEDIDYENAAANIRNVWATGRVRPAPAHKRRTVRLRMETMAALLRLEVVKCVPHGVGAGRGGLLLPRVVTVSALGTVLHRHGVELRSSKSGNKKPAYNLRETFNRTLVKSARSTRDPVAVAHLVGIKNPSHVAERLRAEFKRGRHSQVMRSKVSGKVRNALRGLD